MTIFDKFIDNVKVILKQVTNGQVVILLGQRGKGKSETIKSLCKSIGGKKYAIYLDRHLSAIPMNPDDKKDYNKISGCKVIEDNADILWEPGLYIFEDFPNLTEDASNELYDRVKTARHYGMNFLIVAHDYMVLKNMIFKHANAILLYQDAVITPHQFNPKVGGLGEGHAISRALKDLKQYHYIFVSFDFKKWHNPPLDSRDVGILIKSIRGNLKSSDLSDINYPKRAIVKLITREDTKREYIELLLRHQFTPEQIASALDTSPENVWKEKSRLKRLYILNNGEGDLPNYLKDNRRKDN